MASKDRNNARKAARKRRRDRKPKVRESDVQGIRYVEKLLPLLERLHDNGCDRDRADNRKLHFDQYCLLLLLFFYSPVLTSLRGIQQASELKKVQKLLGCPRASLGSLSEATSVFDPAALKEIIAELLQQAPTVNDDPALAAFKEALVAVDGTLLKKLPIITQAAFQHKKRGPWPNGWKLHAFFDVRKNVPTDGIVTDATNKGEAAETNVAKENLQPNTCYLFDRGYEYFALFNAIVRMGSSYVCRVQNERVFNTEEQRELSPEAVEAGVLSDEVGRRGSSKSKRIELPDHPVRQVTIRVEEHEKRGGRRRSSATQEIVLATNLLDVPAEIVALLYRYRWTIEIYFRFLKHILGCRHLLSHSEEGIEIQTYCAIIACLLISIYTGRKPTLRTYEMICWYFMGMADEDELLAHIEKLKPHSA